MNVITLINFRNTNGQRKLVYLASFARCHSVVIPGGLVAANSTGDKSLTGRGGSGGYGNRGLHRIWSCFEKILYWVFKACRWYLEEQGKADKEKVGDIWTTRKAKNSDSKHFFFWWHLIITARFKGKCRSMVVIYEDTRLSHTKQNVDDDDGVTWSRQWLWRWLRGICSSLPSQAST